VVGFGISLPEMVNGVANMADGVVVGSSILDSMKGLVENVTTAERAEVVCSAVTHLVTGVKQGKNPKNQATKLGQVPQEWAQAKKRSRFGHFGGNNII
jgi:hypothetical protein